MAALAARICRMSRDELSWRLRGQLRTRTEEAAAIVRTPRWNRHDLSDALAVDTLPVAIGRAIGDADWPTAHRLLWRALHDRPSRFVLNHLAVGDVQRDVADRWPRARADALERARAIAAGRFDLLGYRGLSFTMPDTGAIDWHFDPVHARRMPRAFWSRVPYLEPASGDHKIIWELNRQQHWLVLSRALGLAGDRRCARHMVAELEQWLAANPPLIGGNWASMLELGFRSLSWAWGLHAMLGLDAAADEEAGPWLVDLFVALDRHLTHILHNVSLYFSPNTHLTGEALALYVAGTAFPELSVSTRCIDFGRRVLLTELDRQITRDGGHVERSTHYHRYTLDFYLHALLTARRSGDMEAEQHFADAVERLASFASAMADAGGRLPRIGDDDAGCLWPIAGRDSTDIRDSLGLAAALLDRPDWAPWGVTEEVFWLTSSDPDAYARARRMPVADRRIRERRTLPFRAAARHARVAAPGSVLAFPPQDRRGVRERRRAAGHGPGDHAARDRRFTRVFPDTGFVTSSTTSGDHLVMDAGAHGYLNGGHAHADALSIVLTVRGRPLLVDPGTPTYTMDRGLRDHFRSSLSHNTVTVDGVSAAEPDGPFHWRTRADATFEMLRHNAGFAAIEARHDAYRGIEHRRDLIASEAGYFIVDELTGEGVHEASQYWHIDPRWRVTGDSGRALRFVHDDGITAWLLHGRGAVRLVCGDEEPPLGWVSPAYGIRVPAWTTQVTRTDALPFVLVAWCGVSTGDETPRLQRVPCPADPRAAAVAMRLLQGQTECVTMVRPGDSSARDGRVCLVGDIETDARVLQYSSAHGVLTSLWLADATYARRLDGRSLAVQSDTLIHDLHMTWRDTGVDVTTSAEPGRLRLTGSLVAGSVLVNEQQRCGRLHLSPGF